MGIEAGTVDLARDQAEDGDDARPLIGHSAPMRAIKSTAAGIATRRSTIMILGETGSGKEMLARYIHQQSNRTNRPFIPVDCSALADGLFESELFGHVRGAFTGAVRDALGFFRAADAGTLFLDEIGELSLPLQAKLLRVLQERRVVPVGDTQSYPVDVRVICATHRNLHDMVRDGRFREDLYFRLNVIALHMPSLRDRPADILPLAHHFLHLQASLYEEPMKELSAACSAVLQQYHWPGNVRELANVIEHAHVLAAGERVEPDDLPERVRAPGELQTVPSDLHLLDIERRVIAEALRRTGRNKSAAARLLGINVQRLNRRIQRLRIHTN